MDTGGLKNGTTRIHLGEHEHMHLHALHTLAATGTSDGTLMCQGRVARLGAIY